MRFSPKDGLLQIMAFGNDIDTNGFGEAVHKSFMEILDDISQTYGKPGIIDHVEVGSIWNEPQDWMMGLLKKERILEASWDKALPNRVSGIVLQARADSTAIGFLRLTYEFDGWNEYVDAERKEAGTVF